MASQKLFAPFIDGKLPAQAGDVLIIPYVHNIAVSSSDRKGLFLKIKTVSTNAEIGVIPSVYADLSGEFELGSLDLTVGQYYKAQLAYMDVDGAAGFYSTVGVFKYTDNPTLAVELKNNNTKIIGTYSAPQKDLSEKVYYYEFNIYDDGGTLVQSSGQCLHDSSTDSDIANSYDEYELNSILPQGEYIVVYKTISTNGFVSQVEKNLIVTTPVQSKDLLINSVLNANNGVIILQIKVKSPSIFLINETYTLLRTSSLDKHNIIEPLYEFTRDQLLQGTVSYSDYNTQQGVVYKYFVRGNEMNTIYSPEVESISCDFEDMFLFDGSRQLRIKFNPKVTSFKENIQENKITTLGGRYPFFFRNGHTRYKELALQGLISYHMDDNGSFIDESINYSELRSSTPSDNTNVLIEDDFAHERRFKLAVLNWLNDGKPKLFRSPAEGNYIVRITNVSLSPNDTLGRKLHTFSATATEIAECNIANLKANNLV